MPNDWMIYGREKGKGKFRPFTGQGFTGNIIHAMRWPESEGERVQTIVDHLNEDNPGYEFEARRAKGTIFAPAKADKPWLKRAPKPEPDSNELIEEVHENYQVTDEDVARFLAKHPQYTEEEFRTERHIQNIYMDWMYKESPMQSIEPLRTFKANRQAELTFCPHCLAFVQPSTGRLNECPVCNWPTSLGETKPAETLSRYLDKGCFKEHSFGSKTLVPASGNYMNLHDCRTDRNGSEMAFVREYKDGVPQRDCILLNQADYCDYEAEFDREHQDSPGEWKTKKGHQERYVNGKIAYTKTSDPKKVHELNRRPSGGRWTRRTRGC